MSTAGAVSVAPLVGLIWPNHVRHLQRATVFPIIYFFYVFACKSTLVFDTYSYLILRDKNNKLFRFGIVYPSFGRLFDE